MARLLALRTNDVSAGVRVVEISTDETARPRAISPKVPYLHAPITVDFGTSGWTCVSTPLGCEAAARYSAAHRPGVVFPVRGVSRGWWSGTILPMLGGIMVLRTEEGINRRFGEVTSVHLL